ncbi:hypothetical protein C8Q74DRAFT_971679 [Fomes fomentarius]|nr:hypothetical protein C8Q74DRAFT_971679 [Fomes fomentarius]
MSSGVPQIPPAILSGIKETLACIALGGILGTAIYGITVLQTYIYFRRYTHDTLALRSLVAILFALDTVTSSLVAYSIYKYMVIYFEAPLDKYLVILPTLGVENGVTILIATITQLYFAQRLWYVSKNKYLTGGIVSLSLCALGPGIALTVHLFTHTDIFSLGSIEIRILAGFANGLSAICDIVVAAGLCIYLRAGKSGFSRTNNMIDRLMIYAIQRGALTAICQACHMITTVALPGRFIFLPFAFLQGKLYCNTLLATLNVRNSLKISGSGVAAMEAGSHVLASMPRNGSSRHNHGRRPDERDSMSLTALDLSVSDSKGQTSTLVNEHSDIIHCKV